MAIGSDRFSASFRGVSFLVTSESESGGKKRDTHEYPNSDFRFTEELGTAPPVFTVNAIVHGQNANSQRASLISALTRPGVGTLVHPARGSVQVQCVDYTASSATEDNGQHAFSMVFESTRQNATLSAGILSASSISVRVFSTIATMQTAFTNLIQNPLGAINLGSVQSILTSVANDLESVFDVVGLDAIQASLFSGALTTFRSRLVRNSFQGSSISSSLDTLFATTEDLFSDVGDGFESWSGLTTFGDDQDPIERTTYNRSQREDNRVLLNDYVRIYSMGALLESAAFREYETGQEIDDAKETITSAFDQIFLSPDSDLATNEDIRSPMSDVYADTLRILDERAITTPRIVEVATSFRSAALISYQYYANISQEDTIANLNPDINRSAYLDEINVLVN